MTSRTIPRTIMMASDLREDPCCPIDPRWIFAANAQLAVPGRAMRGVVRGLGRSGMARAAAVREIARGRRTTFS
jgi:hypothetical protein